MDYPEFRILVCGGRDFTNETLLNLVMDAYQLLYPNLKIIHGAAKGADKLADSWAKSRGIKYRDFPAEWSIYGNAAGPIRNKQMLDEGKPHLVVAFPGKTGTLNMVKQAEDRGVKVIKVSW